MAIESWSYTADRLYLQWDGRLTDAEELAHGINNQLNVQLIYKNSSTFEFTTGKARVISKEHKRHRITVLWAQSYNKFWSDRFLLMCGRGARARCGQRWEARFTFSLL